MAAMTALAIGAGVSAIGGAVAANQADKAAGRAQRNKTNAQRELDAAKASRASIINPYASTRDLSSMAKDLSGQISNPYANLGVATQAAEIQMEQADMALANTLDTLRATGASAGGATALAQAALQSKRAISNDIQKQEMQNAQLKAQGEQNLQQRVAAEQARVQGVQISEGVRLDSAQLTEAQRTQAMAYQEGQRLQNAEAMGAEYMFAQEERRTIDDLNRLNSQITGAQQAQQAAAAGGMTALGNLGQSLGNLGNSLLSD